MENNSIELERRLARYKSIVKCESIFMIILYSIPALFCFVMGGIRGIIGFTTFFFFLPLIGYIGIKISRSNDISTTAAYKMILFVVTATSGGSSVICLIGFLGFFIYLENFECTKEMYDTCGAYIGVFAFFIFIFGFIGLCSVIIFSLFSIFACHAKKFHDLLLAKESMSLSSITQQLQPFQYPQENQSQAFRPQQIPTYQYIPMQEIPQRVV